MAALLDRGFEQADQMRVASASPAARGPQFDAMGLVMKQDKAEDPGEGDTADDQPATKDETRLFAEQFRPKPISTRTLGAYESRAAADNDDAGLVKTASAATVGNWVVQIGSFGNQASGMQALKQAQRKLTQQSGAKATPVVVPLSTNRGVIYRARLTGMSKDSAESACRVLKGNCLILSAQ
jgi:D-alanyl-D-alanine carboxypeptidase